MNKSKIDEWAHRINARAPNKMRAGAFFMSAFFVGFGHLVGAYWWIAPTIMIAFSIDAWRVGNKMGEDI